MPFIEALGQQAAGQAAGNAINEAMGIAFQPIKNKQQAKQARKLQDIQLEGEATRLQRNEALAMRMWENTNYPAQMEQLIKAGLNPGLLYGMGGGAGGTTAQAPSSGGTATAETAKASHGAEGMGIQAALLDAQRRNIEADTKNKLVDAAKKEGVDTVLAGAQADSLKQGIENQKVQKALTEVQDSILRNELFEKYKTQDWRFDLYAHQAKEQIEKAKSAMATAKIDQATIDEKIQILQRQAIGELLKNELTERGISKTETEIAKIANDIAIGWANWTLEERKTQIIERVGKFQSAQSQRTFDNIIKGLNTITGGLKPIQQF